MKSPVYNIFVNSHTWAGACCKPNVVLLVMKLSIHRAIAAVVMGSIAGWYNHHIYVTWNQRGKDAFISHELQRFDMHMAHPHSLMFTATSAIIGSAVVFAF